LGSIEQYPGEQGRKAAEILFELIDDKENQEAREVILPTKLILK
jgi:DNA-binding LacI/PurR family transcriptional regulator